MNRLLFFVALLSIFNTAARAQQGTAVLRGTVTSEEGTALPGIAVFLLKASDSGVVKINATDAAGIFLFENLSSETYLVKAVAAGRPTQFSAPLIAASEAVPLTIIFPKAAATTIGEVAVRASKPLIEVRPDMTVLNVDASPANAGSTVFEVLQRAPGVTVDNNDNFSLKGKPGVTVMVDGRIVPLRGTDLANLLRGMPSASIEKIELISNPGARYDAAGTGGILHIRTKRDNKMGANGTAMLTGGSGLYPKTGAGLSGNFRTKGINVFASYNGAARRGFNGLTLDRRFLSDGALQQAYQQDNMAKIALNSHVLTGGVEWKPSSKTAVGLTFNGAAIDNPYAWDNGSTVLNAALQPLSTFHTITDNRRRWDNAGAAFNVRHTFDSVGRELSVDADAARYTSSTEQNLRTTYTWLDGAEQRIPFVLYGTLDGHTDIYVLKSDYVHPIKNGLKLEGGFKASLVTADNKPIFYDRSGGGDVYDSTRSNHFVYTENINAAYANASRDWERWGFQVGLRAENTRATGEQKVYNQRFERDYTQLFPSLVLSYHLTKIHDLGLTLARRIERPTYQQLNPFRDYMDATSVHQGNPYLNPALTYSVEASHTFKNRFNTTAGWSRTDAAITQVIQPDEALSDSVQVTSVTDRNLAVNTVWSLSGSYPLQPQKWWSSVLSVNAYYSRYEGDLVNTPLADGTAAFQVSSNNSFTLSKGWSGEVSGWYQSPQRYGYMLLHDMFSVNVGLQKSMLDKRLTAKLSATDLFLRQNPRGSSTFRDYDEDFIVRRDTRTAMLTLTYRFGKRSVEAIRRRAPGAEEERRRAGGGGGAA